VILIVNFMSIFMLIFILKDKEQGKIKRKKKTIDLYCEEREIED
jgi:hypothetical protein